MPSSENHPQFPLSIDRGQKIWRYMDFTKFMDLLKRKSIWLNRSDLFEDHFEGTYPLENLKQFRKEDPNITEKLNEHLRQFTYVNCWHISDHESAAMWGLYSQSNEAIAIQSTYETLHQLMPAECFVGEVQYLDFKKSKIAPDNTLAPYLVKREAYSHERELRVVLHEPGSAIKKDNNGVSKHDYSIENKLYGKAISLNPLDLIHKVHIAPMSASWYKELAENVCLENGIIKDNIVSSELEERPY